MSLANEDVTAALERLAELHAEASKAPWGLVGGTHDRMVIDDHGCHVATTGIVPDAALIVATVNALPRLLAAIRAAYGLAEEWLRDGSAPQHAIELRAALAEALEVRK